MIFYFTATGNSLWIAERLASGLDDKCLDISKEMDGGCEYELKDGESVGFVIPVHFYGLPLIVEEFLRKMKVSGLSSVYLVFNYGTFPGGAFKDAERTFARYGYSVSSEYGVRMPENYVMLFQPPVEKESDAILKEAERTVDGILTSLRSDRPENILPATSVLKSAFGSLSRPIYLYGRGTGRFYTLPTCTHCGRCARICPSKAIEMIDNIPTWTKSKCFRCNACINRCPQRAIEFGHLTKNKRRYTNRFVEFK